MTESLRDKLLNKGWVTEFNVNTLVRLIEKHYSETPSPPLASVNWDPEERLQLFRDYLAAFPGDHNGVTNNSARFQGFAACWLGDGQDIEDEETGFYPDDKWPPDEITIRKGADTDYRLVLSCPACPEAWEVFLGGREVGYLRLRHGHFTARFPDHLGKVVFETTEIQGDGCFADEKERMRNLKKAITRIHREVKKEGGKPSSS